tara:strand:+ start:157 stop:384 length:228 start_codon:yes stop_codon:yes gene_type:complete
MGDKAIREWIEHHLKNKDSSDLWDLQAAVLTELSERDSVQYRVRATEPTVAARMKQLDRDLKDGIDEITHDSEGC